MALIVLDCLEHIRHRLGATDDGDGLSHDLSGLDVINAAGLWIMGAHRWKWAQRQSATLDTVAGQNYVTLPADFATIGSIDTSSLASGIEPTTLERIQEYDKAAAASTSYVYAVEWDHTAGIPTARLRIWPTPTSAETGTFTIYYRAKWAQRTGDAQSIFLPEFMHPLFIETCREYAMGWEEADDVPLGARLSALQAGPLWAAARSQDAQVQPSYGRLANGMADAVEFDNGNYRRFFEANGPS